MQSSPQLTPQLTPPSKKKKIPHTPKLCRNPTPGKKKQKEKKKKTTKLSSKELSRNSEKDVK
ncbi:hypothetical protein BDZ91DRAFT_750427 [Kalaharituber pfeilii]|nr:hypothetical protein BDZ91DRAFT_750427 [Kalaharituber pfeilii]